MMHLDLLEPGTLNPLANPRRKLRSDLCVKPRRALGRTTPPRQPPLTSRSSTEVPTRCSPRPTSALNSILVAALVISGVLTTAAEPGFSESTEWRYFKGVTEASWPDTTAWRQVGFDDQGWPIGPAPFYYEDKATGYTGNTRLSDMRGNYLAVFLRKTFPVPAPGSVLELRLDLRVDDGCIVWLNGQEIARVNMPAGEPTFRTTAVNANNNPNVFSLAFSPEPGLLLPGENVLAVQAANISLSGSSDFLFVASLGLEIDDRPPRVEAVFPTPGIVLRELTGVEVAFNRAVVGVDATDLLVNGQPAAAVQAHSPADYAFSFPEPPEGLVTLTWAGDHGITDTSPEPVPFAGGEWTYTLDHSAPPPQVVISEFLADNGSGIRDEDGARSDWIELRNLGIDPVSLAGWFLTDDVTQPAQWRFPPDVTLAPGAYLVVWASGKDRAVEGRELHTNFSLARAGEYLALLDAQTNVIDVFEPVYPPQQTDISYGRDLLDPESLGYFATPTPGAPNVPGGPGFAPDPVFTIPGGLYVTNQLFIEIHAPSGTLYYSTNGVPPAPRSGIRYTGPIPINASTMLLARVYEPGLLPSRVVAECYQFVAASLAGFSSNLPLLIIQPAQPGISGVSSARTPVFVTAIEPFRGQAALLDPPTHRGMGGLNIRGQSSRGFPKKQYRLELTDPAGLGENVPLLGLPPDDDWILNGPYSDKSLLNNFLAFELHEQMGHYAVRRRFVEVFLDETRGELVYPADYRGIYVLLERIKINSRRLDIARMGPAVTAEPELTGGYIFKKDKDSPGDLNFTTRGGAGFSAQSLKYHAPHPRDINTAQRTWLRDYLVAFEEALYASDWLTRTGARHYSHFIDIDAFVDNHWIVEFTKQIDGYRLSNYLHKDRGGKVHMSPIWDWNLSLGNADYLAGWNPVGWYYNQIDANGHIWLRRLITGTTSATTRSGDPDFNQAIVDRWSVLRTNLFHPATVNARIDEIAAYLDAAKDREFARWPRLNTYVWPNPPLYIQPTYGQIIANKKQWIQDRFDWIDSQVVRTPEFSHPGGRVAPGFHLTLSAPAGPIFFTTDGSDPRAPGGGTRPQATTYTQPIRIDHNSRVVARARPGDSWSGPIAGTWITALPPLRVSELMYHPAPDPDLPDGTDEDPSDFEFIELVNLSDDRLELTGFRFVSGVQFDFSGGAVLALPPGGRVLVVGNRVTFESRYGLLPEVAGEFTGRLNNAGETLRLVGPFDEVVQEFTYDGAWYPGTRGLGFSLVPVDLHAPPATWSTAAGWRHGSTLGGTPGWPEPPASAIPAVVVQEILSHPEPSQPDAIELHNPTGNPADLSGWYLSDRRSIPRYQLPAGTLLPSGGLLLIDRSEFDFGLSAEGEEVYLFSATPAGELTGYAHGFAFGPSPPGLTFGRHLTSTGEEHFVLQSQPSLGAPNAGPRVGPVVISEIMYRPAPGFAHGDYWELPEDEYLELCNLSNHAVPLFDPEAPARTWELADGVRFQFPPSIVLAPGERMLIVSFDPETDPAQAEAFRSKYQVPRSTRILGPWRGRLSNRGETIDLLQPISELPDSLVLVDRVDYRAGAPWPAGADGLGFALQRHPENVYGNDPAHWLAAQATPGAQPMQGFPPGIIAGPATVATAPNRTVTLTVQARSEGAVHYQWRQDGVALPGATTSTLTLTNVHPDQSGAYDVVVFNDQGATVSDLAWVHVVHPDADSDGDGLTDLYELTHGLDPYVPDDIHTDPDGDGVSTWKEFLAGTNPLDPHSRLGFHRVELHPGTVQLAFEAAANRAYDVEVRDGSDPDQPWQRLVTVPVLDLGSAALRTELISDSTQALAPARYYRLQVHP
jgi:hypothetical protein